MTSISAGHIILTPAQSVGSGRPQQESNPGPPHQELRALIKINEYYKTLSFEVQWNPLDETPSP